VTEGGVDARVSNRERLAAGVTYTTFAAAGVGVVLPGALLPLLLTRWSMNDAQGGALFFLLFLGSMTGAVLARGRLPRTAALGAAAVAAGALAMAVASRTAAFAAIPLFGLGLGVVMTSVSLLQSRRHPQTRAAQMARLNLTWSVGALIGPPLLLRGAVEWGVPPVLGTVALLFAVMGMLVWLLVPNVEAEKPVAATTTRRRLALPVLLMLAAAPLATGTESAMGGWLTTYAKRSGDALGLVVGAVTCFWAGMLLSRLIQSHAKIAEATQRATLRWGPALMVFAVVLVLASHGGLVVLAGAFLTGIGIGPMYPLLLALVLREGEGGNIVFVLAGAGAAALPLLTGLVSQAAGSLRAGLVVPLAGSAGLAILCWTLARSRKNSI
jgi:FHS family glucose/mannose:H+ symporter-like MFS transporter